MGQRGETLAEEFLKRRGCRILDRNFRSRWGELDLIVRDRGVVCFIEVKTRGSDACGKPLESVSLFKRRKLIKTALHYLQSKHLGECAFRFDVVGIELDDCGVRIDWVKSAFDAE